MFPGFPRAVCLLFSACGIVVVTTVSAIQPGTGPPLPKPRFSLGFLPTLTNKRHIGGHSSKHFVGAFMYAVEVINNDSSAAAAAAAAAAAYPFHLDYEVFNSRADPTESIRGMITQYNNGSVAFIGPEDTCAAEATVAAAMKLPMIAFKCRESAASNGKVHPTFVRTVPSTSKVSKSIISLMKTFSWTSYTAIVGNSSIWREAAATLKALAAENDITVNQEEFFHEPFDPLKSNCISKLVENTYRNTRTYVILGDYDALIDFVRFMQTQHKSGHLRKDEYSVIAVKERAYSHSERQNYIKKFDENITNLNEELVDAFQQVLILLPREPSNPDYKQLLDNARKYSYEEPFNAPRFPDVIPHIKAPVPIYAAYLYDAVSIYAKALKEALNEGIDVRNGAAIVRKIKGRTYESIQGHSVYIDENGDAEANYTLLALLSDPEMKRSIGKSRSLLPVGHFITRGDSYPVFNSDRTINWISGRPPVSEPKCGFNGDLCGRVPVWPTVVGVFISLLIVVMAVVMVTRHYIYEQKLASRYWKIDRRDLEMEIDQENESNQTEKRFSIDRTNRYRRLSFLSIDDRRDSSRPTRLNCFTRVAFYRGTLFAVKILRRKNVEATRSIGKELTLMKELTHDNVNRFTGVCIEATQICIVTHYCSRGSLKDILGNPDIRLDGMFIASLVFDLLKGMIFIHDSEIVSHGNLKPSNCLVDGRWILQVSDFGLHELKKSESSSSSASGNVVDNSSGSYDGLLYRSPELLRNPFAPSRGSQKGDVYSFALILYEIHAKHCPWDSCKYPYSEIISMVQNPFSEDPLRPDLSSLDCADSVIQCIEDCWDEIPDLRPDFKAVRVRLKSMQSGLKPNIFDNMLAIMEKYASTLETLVEDRTNQLAEEKKKTEALLLRMLPKSVAEQLIGGEQVIPEHYDSVTIYFSDIVGFTALSAESTPFQVVDMLNDLYTMFDSIIDCYDVYKVETIGDAYMVVSGLPLRSGDAHAASAVASMALHLLNAIKGFTIRHRPNERLQLRIGIHSGPVVAAVVGLKMPRYCLFGDTVNTASRMESTGTAFTIHCSPQCKELLDICGGYLLEPRGPVSMKGKGEMFTYFLIEKCSVADKSSSPSKDENKKQFRYSDRRSRSSVSDWNHSRKGSSPALPSPVSLSFPVF